MLYREAMEVLKEEYRTGIAEKEEELAMSRG
jgi:hypothetical protein